MYTSPPPSQLKFHRKEVAALSPHSLQHWVSGGQCYSSALLLSPNEFGTPPPSSDILFSMAAALTPHSPFSLRMSSRLAAWQSSSAAFAPSERSSWICGATASSLARLVALLLGVALPVDPDQREHKSPLGFPLRGCNHQEILNGRDQCNKVSAAFSGADAPDERGEQRSKAVLWSWQIS